MFQSNQPAFNFGSTSTTSSVSFPLTQSSTTNFASSGFGNQASGFGLISTSSQPTSFGGTSSGFGTSLFGTQSNPAVSQQSTIGFGSTNLLGAISKPSTGFGSFGTSNTSLNTKPPAFGVTNPSQQQPTLTLNFNTSVTTATATSTTTLTGLGGATLPSNNEKSGTDSKQNKSYRDTPIPPELIPLVENMKKFLEKQKQIRDENEHEHFYLHQILEIGTTIEDILRDRLNKLEIQTQKNSKAIESLKKDTNKLLTNGELVFRMSKLDQPLSNSAEVVAQNNFINSKTHQYFMDLVENSKTQMTEYSEQIKTLKSHCASSTNDRNYSADEISQIIRKQHENFVTLASKVYLVHEYANKLRTEAANKLNDISTQSTTQSQPIKQNNLSNDHYGPTPFLSKTNSPYLIGVSGDNPSSNLGQQIPSSLFGSPSSQQQSSFSLNSNNLFSSFKMKK
ncbi:Synaptonemal complex protein 1 (SCP-1)-like protein [Sarcoptes scabiei]|uniref:Nucleoporin p58/p45 n=1 Tax=Sarcoptes scabiei TaxID=52283 RepID=A0A132A3Y9_SARSC|nr:Synaptonemal complex protein 1 (SCP-1)-like protein [Sarcoptes scabiei]